MPPPSSGGTTVGEVLNILEGLPLSQRTSREQALHYFLEASRYAFADRGAYLGDPDFVAVPRPGSLQAVRGAAACVDHGQGGVPVPCNRGIRRPSRGRRCTAKPR